jgi:hypothetical protein
MSPDPCPYEVKQNCHRLLASVSGGDLQLISRNGHDRIHLFREPFRGLTGSMALDGEIAVPNELATLIRADRMQPSNSSEA